MMLDSLPQELFSDPNTTFLDPCCKSGVFLREIAKRLLTEIRNRLKFLVDVGLSYLTLSRLSNSLSGG
jgi:excinuclease UvrABC ATPase subunit